MNYPLPGYAATIWYNGDGYTIISGPPDGQTRTTVATLREAEEQLQYLYRAAAATAEARIRGCITSPFAKIEFDMTGGHYTQLARPMSDERREELRKLADAVLRRPKAKASDSRPKSPRKPRVSLEDLGL